MSDISHLSRRLIPCRDVRNGRLTKGVKFEGNIDIGDPVETARRYYEEGADEIVFYDITASHEARGIFLDVVERVASNIFIPFSVGGGISSVEEMRAVLLAGAEKVSVNSSAVKDPYLISRGADAFGAQAIVVGMDVKQAMGRFFGAMPKRFEAADGPCKLEGVLFTIDTASKRCIRVERVDIRD